MGATKGETRPTQKQEEDDEDAWAAKTATFETKVREVCREDCGASSHEQTCGERARNPVAILAKETARFEFSFELLGSGLSFEF